jgi:hypothetical protein
LIFPVDMRTSAGLGDSSISRALRAVKGIFTGTEMLICGIQAFGVEP